MLNLEQISSRIVQPDLCQREELSALKELTEKYPYSQLFSILYLKALSIHNDIHFEDELANHAYRITDRSQLFDLIHSSQSSTIPVEKVIAEPIEQPKESIPELTILRPESDELKITIDEKVQLEASSEIEAIVVVEEDLEEQRKEEEEEQRKEEERKEEERKEEEEEIDQFDREILSQALVSGYLPEEVQDEGRSFEEEGTEEGDREDPSAGSGTEEEGGREEEEVAQRSFTSWLRSNANEIPHIDVEKARIDDLVNQFISKEPSITRPSKDGQEAQKPKTEFYSAAKKAKESLDMGSMPVSETLAKIFALQGNYPKAIFAYEQLMLSNPEKKIFFASQIEELQKKLNT
jgi:hypothetical protein